MAKQPRPTAVPGATAPDDLAAAHAAGVMAQGHSIDSGAAGSLAVVEADAAGVAANTIPATPMAPVTNTAASTQVGPGALVPDEAADEMAEDQSQRSAFDIVRDKWIDGAVATRIVGTSAPMPVGPQPGRHVAPVVSVLDELLHHADAVVRARAAEAIAAAKHGAADAGMLARAAVDTARELDRSAGRVTRTREFG